MKKRVVDLVVDRGATFRREVEIVDDAGNPADFSGFTGNSAMAQSGAVGDPVLIGITLDGDTVVLTLSAEETAALEPGRYSYDALVSIGGVKTRILSGRVTVRPGVAQ